MTRPAPRVAFVTCRTWPDVSESDALVAGGLARRGVEVAARAWNDPGAAVAGFDAVVLRSCWDYHQAPEAFLAWLDGLAAHGARLWNPAPVVRWNLDKRYLLDLARAGVGVPDTVLLERDGGDLPAVMDARGWTRAVVKPLVAASAHGATLVERAEASAVARALAAGEIQGPAMAQPFVEEIRTRGEWSVVAVEGVPTHAVLKQPAAGDFRVQPRLGGRAVAGEAPPAVTAAARRALAPHGARADRAGALLHPRAGRGRPAGGGHPAPPRRRVRGVSTRRRDASGRMGAGEPTGRTLAATPMPNEPAGHDAILAPSRWRLLCLGSLALFAALAVAAHAGGVLVGDHELRRGLLGVTHTLVDEVVILANFAGSWKGLLPGFVVVFALSPVARRHWWLWVAALGAGGLGEHGVKWLVGRARPVGESLGFPSGHVTAITAFAVIVIYLASREGVSGRRRLALLGGLAVLVMLVGLARIFLNAHWPSDLLGGLLLGAGCGAAAAWWHSAQVARAGRAGRPAAEGAG